MKIYKRILLVLLSSGMLVASFASDNFAFIAWVALVPYFIAISRSNMPSSVFLSWTEGLLFFAGVTYWFTEYSYVFWFPILGILSIFFIFYGIVFSLIFKRIKWLYLRVFLVSSVWIAVEFFRHRTFLAFPWGVIGYSQHAYLPVMQISKLTGILGVSLLVVLFNLCITEFINYIAGFKSAGFRGDPEGIEGGPEGIRKETATDKKVVNILKMIGSPWESGTLKVTKTLKVINEEKTANKKIFKQASFIAVIAVILIVVVNMISGCIYMRTKGDCYTGEKLDIVLVQPNISFDDKFETDTFVLIPEKSGTGGEYFKEGTELVVFPESVIWGGIDRERNKTFYQWVSNTAETENLYFIMGQILWDEKENYYNTVQLYNPRLEILGRYNKIHPLPCAEYMPYPETLGFLSFLNIAKTNITPARQFILIDYPGRGSIGTNICFESTLGIISRTYRKMGADILFTFTDTAGFKDSIVAWHHLIFSRVRAVENSSFMVHSGNNGISAIIDPYGRILAKTKLVKKDILYGIAYFDDNRSLYSEYGELLLYIYFGLVFGFLIFYIIRKLKGNLQQDR